MQEYLDVLTRSVQEWMPEDRPASQAPAAVELAKIMDVRLADEGSDQQSLEDAVKAYLHYKPAVYKCDFYKLLYSGQNKPALLGDWITSLSNATMHTYQMSPVATLMELELIRQWNRLVGFDDDENQAHYSVQKAANVLGIGTDNLIAVASDDQGRICPFALQHAPCSEIARKHDIWLHIDGAWGGPILFSEQHRHLLAESHQADSFTWDAHKLMNIPITAAVILVRHAGALKSCCSGGRVRECPVSLSP